MQNTYLTLTVAQVRAITDRVAQAFNTNQLKGLLGCLDFMAAALVSSIVPASTSVYGVVKQASSQPAAAGATPTKAEYDALLTALRNAGIMA
jgi:hypothetical protein